jgi:hypothetical protein
MKKWDGELYDAWVKALRTSKVGDKEIKQTFGLLEAYENEHCPLGVLCLVGDASTSGWAGGGYSYVKDTIGETMMAKVYRQNDRHNLTFDQMADWIEQNIPRPQ